MSATGPDDAAASLALQASRSTRGNRDGGYARAGPEGRAAPAVSAPECAAQGISPSPRLVSFARVPARSRESVSRLPSRRTTRPPFPFSKEPHPSLQTGDSREGWLAASGGDPRSRGGASFSPLKRHFRVRSTSPVGLTGRPSRRREKQRPEEPPPGLPPFRSSQIDISPLSPPPPLEIYCFPFKGVAAGATRRFTQGSAF